MRHIYFIFLKLNKSHNNNNIMSMSDISNVHQELLVLIRNNIKFLE